VNKELDQGIWAERALEANEPFSLRAYRRMLAQKNTKIPNATPCERAKKFVAVLQVMSDEAIMAADDQAGIHAAQQLCVSVRNQISRKGAENQKNVATLLCQETQHLVDSVLISRPWREGDHMGEAKQALATWPTLQGLCRRGRGN
jgi:hypothetical protein